jgi:TolB-like protein
MAGEVEMAEGGGDGKNGGDAAPVFVSYASQDAAGAASLVEALERHGIACWIAPRDIKAGALYADAIVRAISGAKAFILVLSESAIASSHVSKEIERASSKKRPIITLRIDAAPLTPALEYFLSESQWVEAQSGSTDTAYSKIVEAIKEPLRAQRASTLGTLTPTTLKARFNSGRNRILVAVTLVGIIALAALFVDKLWLTRRIGPEKPTSATTTVTNDKSIAVLPFVDFSEKRDQEYFADGLADEVLELLANVPGLKVIGRTSSFQFKGKSQDLREIGDALKVNYVVEGSVRKSGEQMRISAQLVTAHDGSHLWSGTYDTPVGDTLKVQDQIASNLARALQLSLGADLQQARPFSSNEAYDLYLRGRYAYDRFDKEGLESARAYFRQALELDPASGLAAECLAIAQEDIAAYGYAEPNEGFQRAREFSLRALRLDQKSSLAHATLAEVHLIYDWDWDAAEREATEAIRLKPRGHSATGMLGEVYEALGRWDDSARLFEAALALDPLFSVWHGHLSNIRLATGRLQEAEAEQRKVLQISPTFGGAHYALGIVLLAQGKLEGALAEMQQEQPDSGRNAGLAAVYHAMGRGAESNAALAQEIRDYAQVNAEQIADAYAYRGEADQAFAWLERAYRQKDASLFLIKGDALLKNLKDDSRYKAFLRKMNLPE